MRKFYKFTQTKTTHGENGYLTKRKDIYISLDSIVSIFENHYGSVDETVIGLVNGQSFAIEEPMNEVMKILGSKE